MKFIKNMLKKIMKKYLCKDCCIKLDFNIIFQFIKNYKYELLIKPLYKLL